MEYFKLNNGIKITKVGYEVYQIPKEECVLIVIESWYRLIDAAQAYLNKAEVGNTILKCGVLRAELFIATKIWITNFGYKKSISS